MNQTRTQLTEFTGKPLIQIPKVIPQANFLTGDFGKAVAEEYQGRTKTDYCDNQRLRVLQYDEKDQIDIPAFLRNR